MSILITGFEPFAGEPRNPSGEIALELDGGQAGGEALRGLVLPVRHETAWPLLRAALDRLLPRSVLALGLAMSRSVVCVEQVAVNIDDFRIADNDGAQPMGEPIEADGPDAYFTTLPVGELVTAVRLAGIPARVSRSAGTYLCNHVYYRLLHEAAQRSTERRYDALFVHLPPLPECVAAADQERASMDLSRSKKAVEVILGIIALRV